MVFRPLPTIWLAGTLILFAPLPLAAQVPLHQRIDEAITRSKADLDTPLAGDAEFLRRVTLDLTGTIPSAAEAARSSPTPRPTSANCGSTASSPRRNTFGTCRTSST